MLSFMESSSSVMWSTWGIFEFRALFLLIMHFVVQPSGCQWWWHGGGIKIMQNGPSKIKIIWLLQTFCFCIFISKFVTFTILVSNERPLLAFLVVLTSIDTYRHKFLLHTFGHDLNLVWLTIVCVWKMFLFHQGIRRIH
jgi:hypothetical protein